MKLISTQKLYCNFSVNSSRADDEVSYYVILGSGLGQFANFISSYIFL